MKRHETGVQATQSATSTIEAYAYEKAVQAGVRWEQISNLIYHESRWKPDADNGEDRGLVQISRTFHPEITDEQAFDPYWAIDYAVSELAAGREHQWVVCNCYLLVKSRLGPALPRSKEIVPNSPPLKGAVAIFNYHGTIHFADVYEDPTGDTVKLFESNFEPCKVGFREITLDDPFLVGFWFPG